MNYINAQPTPHTPHHIHDVNCHQRYLNPHPPTPSHLQENVKSPGPRRRNVTNNYSYQTLATLKWV